MGRSKLTIDRIDSANFVCLGCDTEILMRATFDKYVWLVNLYDEGADDEEPYFTEVYSPEFGQIMLEASCCPACVEASQVMAENEGGFVVPASRPIEAEELCRRLSLFIQETLPHLKSDLLLEETYVEAATARAIEGIEAFLARGDHALVVWVGTNRRLGQYNEVPFGLLAAASNLTSVLSIKAGIGKNSGHVQRVDPETGKMSGPVLLHYPEHAAQLFPVVADYLIERWLI